MTNHAYLDRLTALFLIASCGGLSADHGQKRELGGVTITGGLDLIGPITEGVGPLVDYEFKCGRLFDRQIHRLRAVQSLVLR